MEATEWTAYLSSNLHFINIWCRVAAVLCAEIKTTVFSSSLIVRHGGKFQQNTPNSFHINHLIFSNYIKLLILLCFLRFSSWFPFVPEVHGNASKLTGEWAKMGWVLGETYFTDPIIQGNRMKKRWSNGRAALRGRLRAWMENPFAPRHVWVVVNTLRRGLSPALP